MGEGGRSEGSVRCGVGRSEGRGVWDKRREMVEVGGGDEVWDERREMGGGRRKEGWKEERKDEGKMEEVGC